MLKNAIIIILLSLGALYGAQHIQPVIMAFVSWHNWLSQLLLQVFAGGEIGSAIRGVIAMIVMPLVIGAIPAGVYYFSKRRAFPYFWHVVWVIWLVQTTTLLMLHHLG